MQGKPEGKSDRALLLREKGLTVTQIAERLGTTPKNAGNLVNATKLRRAKISDNSSDPHATDLALAVAEEMRTRP